MKIRIQVLSILLFYNSLVLALNTPQRIITLGTAVTETVDALGLGDQIVATDVTSEYPAYIKKLPKVSRNRSLSVEGLMQFKPQLILAPEGEISAAVLHQLKKAAIRVVSIKQEYSVKGAEKFIMDVARALDIKEKGALLAQTTQKKLQIAEAQISSNEKTKLKVLFIYARGAGNMTVAGKGSNMDAIISLSGARNAVQEFAAFKPYSTEALIKTNPDVILLFDFGATSLGGTEAVLKMPGVKLTGAGKNKRIVEVDGNLMVNFATRLPEAMQTLHTKLYN